MEFFKKKEIQQSRKKTHVYSHLTLHMEVVLEVVHFIHENM